MILDLSAGYRGIWYDKRRADVVYLDLREQVRPDLVADSTCLPFRRNTFDLVVFDPPHANFGARSNMARDYGHRTMQAIVDLVAHTAEEAHRVARAGALLAFKWNDHDRKLAGIVELLTPYWEPLFGALTAERTARGNRTWWLLCSRGILT
jgi:hypothetical protein